MSGDTPLLSLVEEGHDLLARERADLLAGRFDALGEIAQRKSGLLDALEQAIAGAHGTPAARRALDSLIQESRRNEGLLGAALTGIRSARRSISAILATRHGDVAYAPDGSRITSRADAAGKSSRA